MGGHTVKRGAKIRSKALPLQACGVGRPHLHQVVSICRLQVVVALQTIVSLAQPP